MALIINGVVSLQAKVASIDEEVGEFGKKIVLNLITAGIIGAPGPDAKFKSLSDIEAFDGITQKIKIDFDLWRKHFSSEIQAGKYYLFMVVPGAFQNFPTSKLVKVIREISPQAAQTQASAA